MAMFTTELRTIIKSFSDSHNIDEQIENAKPHVFDNSWQIVDGDYTSLLQTKILRHYYMREIGFETVNLFVLKLNTELSEIAPKYTMLYNALNDFKDAPLSNVDVTETNKETGTGTTNTSGTSSSDYTTSTKARSESAGTNTGTGSGGSDAWQTSNDTPQGGLDGIESNRYLSSAVHNKSTTEQSSESKSDTSATSTQEQTNASSAKSGSDATTNTTSEYVKKIIGKNSSSDNIEVFQKLYTDYLNIDKMLIDELDPLFMGLWE